MILRLVWRNLWRNRRRTFITMASVTFAVMLAVCMKSLQQGVFDHLVKNMVQFYSGYIQMHKAGYQEEQVLDNCTEFPQTLVEQVRQNPAVTAVSPRIESFVLASSDTTTRGCLLLGVDPEMETQFSGLKKKLIAGEYFSAMDNAVLIADGLGKKLRLKPGDTLVLLGQGYQGNSAAGKFRVGGLVHYGSPQLNESLIFLPLVAAQQFFSAENKITTLALNIASEGQLESVASTLRNQAGSEFELLTWKQIMPDIDSHIRADSSNFYLFIGMLYLLIAFGVFGTTLMMLAERKYELGMLLSLGMQKSKLALMLIGETVLISVLGALAGFALSFPVVRYFEVKPIKITGAMAKAYEVFGFEALWPATLDVQIFITQSLIVLFLSLIISIFPLVKVYQLDPVTAMKR